MSLDGRLRVHSVLVLIISGMMGLIIGMVWGGKYGLALFVSGVGMGGILLGGICLAARGILIAKLFGCKDGFVQGTPARILGLIFLIGGLATLWWN